MKLTTKCPNCGQIITSKRWREQDWFFCQACQSIFFSSEGLRENWSSLYKAIGDREKEDRASA